MSETHTFFVSERLPLSDMFKFGIKEYIPYIVVTATLLFALIPTRKLKKPRVIIFIALEMLTGTIFPPIFFFVMQGLSKFTIVLIAFSCSMMVYTIIIWLIQCIESIEKRLRLTITVSLISTILILFIFPPLFSYAINGFSKMTMVVSAFAWSIVASIIIVWLIARDKSRMILAGIISSILYVLIFIIFTFLFFYAAESFNSVSIIFLVLIEVFFLTTAMSIISIYFCDDYCSVCSYCFLTISILALLSIIIYALVIVFKDKLVFIIIIVNLVVGCCLSCQKDNFVGKTAAYILVRMNFYVLFYSMQSKVDPISLLLFWSDLWATLFAIYVIFEREEEVGEIDADTI